MGRARIKLFRRADLTHLAGAHDDDAVGQRQRLFLVMCDIDGRRADQFVNAPDFGAHLDPQFGVEVRQRLIHQHQRRLDDDGARDRHALLLSAR